MKGTIIISYQKLGLIVTTYKKDFQQTFNVNNISYMTEWLKALTAYSNLSRPTLIITLNHRKLLQNIFFITAINYY